jgi:hypothetical protein
MIEMLKDIALTIMAIGFGLAVLFPCIVSLYTMLGFMIYLHIKTWKDLVIHYTMIVLTLLSTVAFISYFPVTIYYIWIK